MKTTTLKRAMILTAALLTFAPAVSQAANAVTTVGGPLSSGPRADYPVLKRLAAGLQVTVHGCLAQWDWCDVTWRGAHGWLPASALMYRNADPSFAVSVPNEETNLPVIGFNFRTYWDENYTAQSWYKDRVQ